MFRILWPHFCTLGGSGTAVTIVFPLSMPAALHPAKTSRFFSNAVVFLFLSKVHILGVGLAVHEKLVHPEMRPLHKKLIDQFQMMRSSLCHVSSVLTPRFSFMTASTPKSLPKSRHIIVAQDQHIINQIKLSDDARSVCVTWTPSPCFTTWCDFIVQQIELDLSQQTRYLGEAPDVGVSSPVWGAQNIESCVPLRCCRVCPA